MGVTVGDRLGDDVPLSPTTTLRAYRVTLVDGTVHPHDHRELRWVTRDELAGLPWVPADTAWLPDLYAALETAEVFRRSVLRPIAAGCFPDHVSTSASSSTYAGQGVNLTLATWVSTINFWAWNLIGPMSPPTPTICTSAAPRPRSGGHADLVGSLGRLVMDR